MAVLDEALALVHNTEMRVHEARSARAPGMRLRAWASLRALMEGESPREPPVLAGPLLPPPGGEPGGIEDSPRLRAVETELSAAENRTPPRRATTQARMTSPARKGSR